MCLTRQVHAGIQVTCMLILWLSATMQALGHGGWLGQAMSGGSPGSNDVLKEQRLTTRRVWRMLPFVVKAR